jgi:hypothetical protein
VNNKTNIVKLLGRVLIYNFIIIVLLVIGVVAVSYIDKNRSKFVIDGKEVNSSYLSMIKEIEGKTYLSLEDALKLPQMKMYKLNNRKI